MDEKTNLKDESLQKMNDMHIWIGANKRTLEGEFIDRMEYEFNEFCENRYKELHGQ